MAEAISPHFKPAVFQGETTQTGALRVRCGGPAVSRHPQVYLAMVDDAQGKPSHVVCPYCSHTFVYKAAMATPGGHGH